MFGEITTPEDIDVVSNNGDIHFTTVSAGGYTNILAGHQLRGVFAGRSQAALETGWDVWAGDWDLDLDAVRAIDPAALSVTEGRAAIATTLEDGTVLEM